MLAGVVAWILNMSFHTHLCDEKAFIELITPRKFMMWSHCGCISPVLYGL